MELVVITSHVPEGIPGSLTSSLVAALQARGRTVHHLSTLPGADDHGEAGTFGVLDTPLDPLLRHRGPVSRCFYVLPADPLAIRSLPATAARVQAARAAGVRFRVHHWILTEEEPNGLVQMFEAACAPLRPDWVLSPWTDGHRWARQVADDLLGPRTVDDNTGHGISSSEKGRASRKGALSFVRRSRTSLRRVSRWVSDWLAGTAGLLVALIILAVVAFVLLFVGLGKGN